MELAKRMILAIATAVLIIAGGNNLSAQNKLSATGNEDSAKAKSVNTPVLSNGNAENAPGQNQGSVTPKLAASAQDVPASSNGESQSQQPAIPPREEKK